jgi:hypothetical protein
MTMFRKPTNFVAADVRFSMSHWPTDPADIRKGLEKLRQVLDCVRPRTVSGRPPKAPEGRRLQGASPAKLKPFRSWSPHVGYYDFEDRMFLQ